MNLVVRAFVVYLAVLILLRISGKKQIGQMGATELVSLLLISNAVQNSMNGGDNSLVGGLILAVVLIVMSSTISLLTFRSRRFSLLLEGSPTLLVHKGQLLAKNLARERLTAGDLRTLLRKQGIHEIHPDLTAVLEADGSLSVTRGADQP
jgi:uncharacterized membrane protein YcaP (DUF421 family)